MLQADVDICALTPARVGLIARSELAGLMEKRPGIALAICRRTVADGVVWRQWMVRHGLRNAYSRVAHLFCELLARYEAAGLGEDESIAWVVTHEALAEALGLSTVQVNSVLQRLRSEGLIEARAPRLQVLDRERLEAVARFEPTYLRPRTPAGSRLLIPFSAPRHAHGGVAA